MRMATTISSGAHAAGATLPRRGTAAESRMRLQQACRPSQSCNGWRGFPLRGLSSRKWRPTRRRHYQWSKCASCQQARSSSRRPMRCAWRVRGSLLFRRELRTGPIADAFFRIPSSRVFRLVRTVLRTKYPTEHQTSEKNLGCEQVDNCVKPSATCPNDRSCPARCVVVCWW